MGHFAENLDLLPGVDHSFGEVNDTGKPSGLFSVLRGMVLMSLRWVLSRRLE